MTMTVPGLLDLLRTEPGVGAVLDAATSRQVHLLDVVAPSGARPVVVAALAAEPPTGAGTPVLAVTATGRETEDLAAALRCLLPPASVVEFPAWETLPHERLSPRSDTVGRRLAVLRRLAHPDPEDELAGPVRVVVAPIRAVMQPLVVGLGDLDPVRLCVGDETGLDEVAARLVAAAYARVDMVERRGEFAVRGGILDVFPPTEDHPLRLEFWGDTVEEIRWFAVADQRSLEIAERGLWAPPCRELLLTDTVRARAAALVDTLPGVADLLERIAEGIAVEGMEALTPALVDGMQPLLDVLPEGTHTVLIDPERIRTRAHDLVATSAEFLAASWENAAAGNTTPIDLSAVDLGAAALQPLADVRGHALASGIPWWTLTTLSRDTELTEGLPERPEQGEPEVVTVAAREVAGYHGEAEKALVDLRSLVADGWRVVATTEGQGAARRWSR